MNIKAIYTILLMTFSLVSFGAEKDSLTFSEEEIDICSIEETAIHNLVDTAKTCLGIPYKYGGTSKKGFDCSGFMGYIFNSYCAKIPRSSREIAKIGNKIERKQIKKGDLIFFKGSNSSSSSIGHVAFVTEVVDGKISMIHSTRRGVIEDVLSEIKYYDSRYLFAIRLDYGLYLGLY
jgi:cell wall-associated NlpC family hydrolase